MYTLSKKNSHPARNGADRRTQKVRGGVAVEFFKAWSPEMAYVLGYFSADGCLSINPNGSRYLHFDSVDKDLLKTVKQLMGARQVISVKPTKIKNWQPCYRIQIGSREIFHDLEQLGFGARKGKRLGFPGVPAPFFPDFVRGYFDGDGGVSYGSYRKKDRLHKSRFILCRFSSESKSFLAALRVALSTHAQMGMGSIISCGNCHQLSYAFSDSDRLFRFMYGETIRLQKPLLQRKYDKFIRALHFIKQGAVA